MESSRTDFEVLGLEGQVLGLEASSPRSQGLDLRGLFLYCYFCIVKIFFVLLKFCEFFVLLKFCEFFVLLKFCEALEKCFGKRFFCGDRLKNFCEDLFFLFFFFFFLEIARKIFAKTSFFFRRALALVSLASSIAVLGLESVCPRKGCPWPWIFLCPWPRALCPRLHLC